jgi:hypothetical protein
MSKQRPDDYIEPIFNLEDLIDAREERVSAFSDDVDGLPDIDQQPDVDVEDALTFPHPHRDQSRAGSEADDTDKPGKEDIGFDYRDNLEETLPSDYSEPYADALSTELEDADVVAEEEIHELGEMTPEDIIYSNPVIEPAEQGSLRDVEESAE